MLYQSMCSGIEAATAAWHGLGWEPHAFSEIEKFPGGVLAHRYPNTPNYGDMTKLKEWPDAALDLLVAGTPCQSFSVAGLRKGLDDPRGNLMLTYLAVANRYRPRWLVWENVPGVLSSNGGRDFAAFLRGLDELGYGWAYRVLDAQYFGVAQRRRRVFVVGYLGDWHRAAAVLFERHSLSGHPAPRREARKETAAGTLRSTDGGSDVDHARAGHLVSQPYEVANCLTQRMHKGINSTVDEGQTPIITHDVVGTLNHSGGHAVPGNCSQDWNAGMLVPTVSHILRGEGFDASEDGTGRGTPLVPVAFSSKDHGADAMTDLSPTLRAGGHTGSHANAGVPSAVTLTMQIRRLTPRECERLQGFADDYTRIPWRNKPADQCPDGPRYKALGNSMAVPVMRWIGQRIQMVDNL